jgi:hypothetical protein
MKIFGNCLVKNEADMIEETLRSAARWCNRIFVFDNGSTDGTWEKVQSLSKELPDRVVPYKSDAVPFRNNLRMDTFNQYRHEASDGDWWCRLDADELYHDDPRAFLANVPRRHHVVWAASFQFYFTDEDERRYIENPSWYPPHSSVEQSLKHHRCDWSEARFFRYRTRMVCDRGAEPNHLGVVHARRIRLKHYQYRSPAQIQLRLETRQIAIQQGCENFSEYSSETDWRQKVVPASSCHRIDDPDPFLIEKDKLPRHMEGPLQRMAKLFLHGTGIWP